MTSKVSTEDIAMKLIAYSGEARTQAFNALKEVRLGDYEKATCLISKAEESIVAAHKGQTELLVNEAQGQKGDITLLLIHAQDHFMTSNLAIELIKELIFLYQN